MSRISSGLPIYSLSRHTKTLTKTAIYRGVYPVSFDSTNSKNAEEMAEDVLAAVAKDSELAIGDKVMLTHGDLMETVGATNTLKVLTLAKKHFA